MKKKILDAFKEPFKSRKNTLNLLRGGILSFFPVISFIPLGYLAEKLRKSIAQDKSAVKWDENIKNLFVKGAVLALICSSYLIIPVLFMIFGGRLMLTLSEGRIMPLFYLRGQILNTMGTLLLLIALYFLPFAICLWLEKKDIKQAFNIKEVSEKIFKVLKKYTIGYLVIIGLMAGSTALMFLFMNILVGIMLSGFIFFYNGLVITSILSKLFPRKSVTISLLEVSDK